MSKNILLLFIAVLVAVPSYSFAATKLEISGWVPYWRVATGTADAMAHMGTFTEINPFAYSMKADGTIKNPDFFDAEPWLSLATTSRVMKVRVVPSVMWSDGNAIHNTLSSATKRRALADEIAALVVAKGWDGIDIDFEGKKAETKPYFSLFLKGLQTRLGNKKWLTCSIETRIPVSSRYTKNPPKNATMYANDLKEIGKYCDRVRVMAYDQGAIDVKLNADALGPYVPIADVKWVEKAVTYMAKEIPKKKLVIGIPTYGYEYEVTPLANGNYSYDKMWAFNPRYAVELSQSLGIPATRNQAGELSFVYTPVKNTPAVPVGVSTDTLSNNPDQAPATVPVTTGFSTTTPFRIVWWSDAQAIADKVALAKRLGIRGVAIFKVDGGEDPLMWSVLR